MLAFLDCRLDSIRTNRNGREGNQAATGDGACSSYAAAEADGNTGGGCTGGDSGRVRLVYGATECGQVVKVRLKVFKVKGEVEDVVVGVRRSCLGRARTGRQRQTRDGCYTKRKHLSPA